MAKLKPDKPWESNRLLVETLAGFPGVKAKYAIIRRYAPHLNRRPETVKFVNTLKQAQEHCSNPATRKAGEWFDGYTDKVTEWDSAPTVCVGILKDESLTKALHSLYQR